MSDSKSLRAVAPSTTSTATGVLKRRWRSCSTQALTSRTLPPAWAVVRLTVPGFGGCCALAKVETLTAAKRLIQVSERTKTGVTQGACQTRPEPAFAWTYGIGVEERLSCRPTAASGLS